ncbi:hypothetical protein GAY33_09460 [Azospirillum brasilense]|uniref:hypothetical protein n=1 Tax=Azospirillum argentinense TaxID=2970906 RepID=UPI001909C812|nr:hypothetical protein [Azospirillum argentinense]MBK3799450.1 hypothetical protein [Azospirillum argentinense]
MSGPLSASKAKLWMEATGTPCATIAEYDALTWVRTKFVGNFGDLTETFAAIEYTDVDEGEDHVLKGNLSRGQFQVDLNYAGTADAGQVAMQTAFDSIENVNIKVTLNNDPGGTNSKPTRFCCPAKVMEKKYMLGDGKRVVGLSFILRIDGKILKGDPVVGSGG